MPFIRGVARGIGRRGSFLLFLATLDILYGYSLYETNVPLGRFNLFLPLHLWGAIWFATGLVCLICAPLRRDRAAFGLGAALMASWAAVLGWNWIVAQIPREWVSMVIFGCFSLIILVISSWPEVPIIVKDLEIPDEVKNPAGE